MVARSDRNSYRQENLGETLPSWSIVHLFVRVLSASFGVRNVQVYLNICRCVIPIWFSVPKWKYWTWKKWIEERLTGSGWTGGQEIGHEKRHGIAVPDSPVGSATSISSRIYGYIFQGLWMNGLFDAHESKEWQTSNGTAKSNGQVWAQISTVLHLL